MGGDTASAAGEPIVAGGAATGGVAGAGMAIPGGQTASSAGMIERGGQTAGMPMPGAASAGMVGTGGDSAGMIERGGEMAGVNEPGGDMAGTIAGSVEVAGMESLGGTMAGMMSGGTIGGHMAGAGVVMGGITVGGCVFDRDCGLNGYCDNGLCAAHTCDTRIPNCDSVRQDCEEGQTETVPPGRNCWTCVEIDTCRIVFAPVGGADGGGEQAAPTCVAEGEAAAAGADALPCCPGLQRVTRSINQFNQCIDDAQTYRCVQCGDGACGPGEDSCNCLDDCEEICRDEGQRFFAGDVCCAGLAPVECNGMTRCSAQNECDDSGGPVPGMGGALGMDTNCQSNGECAAQDAPANACQDGNWKCDAGGDYQTVEVRQDNGCAYVCRDNLRTCEDDGWCNFGEERCDGAAPGQLGRCVNL